MAGTNLPQSSPRFKFNSLARTGSQSVRQLLDFIKNQGVRLLMTSSRRCWSKEKYVAVKINASARQNDTAQSEHDTLRILSETNRHHEGWRFVRHFLDSFILMSSSGRDHLSLVFDPLRESLWIYQRLFDEGVIPSSILKIMLQMILHGLDYIHSECHIIHTGPSFFFPSFLFSF